MSVQILPEAMLLEDHNLHAEDANDVFSRLEPFDYAYYD